MVDQGVVSLANFGTAVLVGKLAGAAELGTFALAFAVLVLGLTVQDCLAIAPHIVHAGERRGRAARRLAGHTLLLGGAIAGMLSVVALVVAAVGWFAAPTAPFAAATLALAIVFPLALGREMVRRLAVTQFQFGPALAIDAATTLVQFALLIALGATIGLTAPLALLSLAAASGVGIGVWLVTRRRAVTMNWPSLPEDWHNALRYGRWLCGARLVSVAHGYSVPWLLPLMLGSVVGLTAAGGFAACATLLAMANPVLMGITNVLGPQAARAYVTGGPAAVLRASGWATLLMLGLAGLVAAGVAVFATPLLSLLYGPEFAAFAEVAVILAAALLFESIEATAEHGLRALRRPELCLWAGGTGLGVTLVLAVILIPTGGAIGGAWALLVGGAFTTMIMWLFLLNLTRPFGIGLGAAAKRLPRFRAAEAAMPALAERETWGRGQIEALQLDCLNELWQHARQHVPHYRDLATELELPTEFASLAEYKQRVPMLRKNDVRADPERFLSERHAPGKWYTTGGSTGTPMRLFFAADEYREALQAKYRFYQSHGVPLFAPITFIWGGHHRRRTTGLKGLAGRLQEHVLDQARRRQRIPTDQNDPQSLERQLREIEQFRPAMIYGFANAIHLMAKRALQVGFRCPSLKLIVMTSELYTPAMKRDVEQAFGAKVASEYGSTESPIIAGEDAEGQWRVREDQVLLETVPSPDGRYEVVISILGNTNFPLLRYAMDDATESPVRWPDVGFAIMPPITGRSDDLLVAGDGRLVHGASLDAVFEDQQAVRRFRVVQDEAGAVVAEIEVDGHLPDEEEAALLADLEYAVPGRPMALKRVDEIPLTRGGKRRTIVSALARDDAEVT